MIIAIFKYRFQEATFNVFMEIVCFNVFFCVSKKECRNRNRIKYKNYESISYSQRVVYSRLECFYISNLRNDKSIFKWQRTIKIISLNECSPPANQFINLSIWDPRQIDTKCVHLILLTHHAKLIKQKIIQICDEFINFELNLHFA